MNQPPDVYGIVGLGNPGKVYEDTRHNVGFRIVDILSKRYSIKLTRKWRLKAKAGSGRISGKPVMLVKPLTYMNLSGIAVRAALRYYRIDSSCLVLVLDDANLETGRIRIRRKGSHGGHNGLASIIDALGTDEFYRVRLGVGAGPGFSLKDHVLGDFEAGEIDLIEKAFEQAAEAVETLLGESIEAAMNKYNKKPELEK